MVKYVIAEQLIGKEVVTSDGMDLGRFLDTELNEVTGKLTSLILSQTRRTSSSRSLT